MARNLREFSRLYFGEASAEAEGEKRPELLVRGYYDLADTSERVESRDAFLLIGPKGAGKSSYVEYRRLKAEGAYDSFVIRRDLGEIRGALKNDATMSGSHEVTELSWSVWIWCQLFGSVMSDQAASCQRDLDSQSLFSELRTLGAIDGDFRSVIQEIRKKQHKFTAPKVYEYSTEASGARRVNLGQLRDVLSEICAAVDSPNEHILAIDGLDSAVIGSAGYWDQLAALLRAANAVHMRLRGARSGLRIVLLCRSDIFMKIPLPDSNKIRQSWAIELDWSYGLDTPEDSYLWDLIEKKASASGAVIDNLVESYFPARMEVAQRTGGRSFGMSRYLMELTRGTPRDMIVLLKKIQEQSREVSELSIKNIRAGVNSYCKQYFGNEMANELIGLLPANLSNTVIGSMSRLEYRRFTRSEFEALFDQIAKTEDFDVDQVLQQLFLAGAIANIFPGRDENYVKFYHRRNHADLSLGGPFIVHTALALSLNLNFGRRPN
ncbi:hypothetical protein ND486_09160 [Pseudonocardia sp. DR1-2]|uniref:P-loop ATPase, Sll1717 family n=1 Tax=Pseudonocardia sp. DR1-2 TaxID=2951168 RepID=UPI00204396A2|nr:hypothetical protein [Pseudonocardia sp. DR1-2]MCM3846357.1 hypothetical protein [Pseudonocardia sp. DR1-2]